ncbi:MAG: hypothetical protein HC881_00560 [Leptolyngbyaceae cyanobacterium SL_7_1]|nr:hypothetical protein [Leptolyngbyaceae cyanobacterium SL_7_1]
MLYSDKGVASLSHVGEKKYWVTDIPVSGVCLFHISFLSHVLQLNFSP